MLVLDGVGGQAEDGEGHRSGASVLQKLPPSPYF